MLTGENGILTKADTATRKTEIAEAKEQAKFDIAEWIADKLEAGEEASLDDTVIQKILEGNYYEYIAEKNTYIQSMPYIYRGGRYSTKGAVSASYRNGDDGLADIGDTFRFMLYV